MTGMELTSARLPKPAAKKSAGGALVKWDEALAKKAMAAQKVAAQVAAGGNFLSFKGGKLSYKDNAIKSNTLDIVVLAAVTENNFFAGAYDSKNPQAPSCYAFGSPDGDDDGMKPHAEVFKAGTNEADECAGCPHNEWGSAEKGRGKRCKNVVKLAFILADVVEGGADAVKKAEVTYAKLPVTSGKRWAGYVNSLDKKHFLQYVTTLELVSDEGEALALSKLATYLTTLMMNYRYTTRLRGEL